MLKERKGKERKGKGEDDSKQKTKKTPRAVVECCCTFGFPNTSQRKKRKKKDESRPDKKEKLQRRSSDCLLGWFVRFASEISHPMLRLRSGKELLLFLSNVDGYRPKKANFKTRHDPDTT